MKRIIVEDENGVRDEAHYTPGGRIPGTDMEKLGTWRLSDRRSLSPQKKKDDEGRPVFKTEDGMTWTKVPHQ